MNYKSYSKSFAYYVKRIFSSVLLIAYFSAINANLISWLEFNINYDFIIKFLCIEKDNEENLCQGSCYLKKNLEQNEEQNKPAEKQNREINSFSLSYHTENNQFISNKLFFNKFKSYSHTINNFISNFIEPESPPPELL